MCVLGKVCLKYLQSLSQSPGKNENPSIKISCNGDRWGSLDKMLYFLYRTRIYLYVFTTPTRTPKLKLLYQHPKLSCLLSEQSWPALIFFFYALSKVLFGASHAYALSPQFWIRLSAETRDAWEMVQYKSTRAICAGGL